MDASAELHDSLHAAGLSAVAPYAVSMAYRIRYYMEMNAREAMHLIELRTAPQGHPAYRRICQAMHTLIAEQAGHRLIAESMSYADHSEVELERLKAERAAERKDRPADKRANASRVGSYQVVRIVPGEDRAIETAAESGEKWLLPILRQSPRSFDQYLAYSSR